jgi:hypothetical protein
VAGAKAGDAAWGITTLVHLVVGGEALETTAGGALKEEGVERFCSRRGVAEAPEHRHPSRGGALSGLLLPLALGPVRLPSLSVHAPAPPGRRRHGRGCREGEARGHGASGYGRKGGLVVTFFGDDDDGLEPQPSRRP